MRNQRGFSLPEVFIVCAIFSLMTVLMVVLYGAARVEFEGSQASIATSQHGRFALQRISQVLSSAVPRRANGDAFYSPDASQPSNLATRNLDFLSSANLLPTSPSEVTYAFDRSDLVVPGYTSLYRYQIAWTPVAVAGVPANSIYLERLQVDPLTATPMSGSTRRLLMRNVTDCQFRRTSFASIQVRLEIYNRDPNSGKFLDGAMARYNTSVVRRPGAQATRQREILTTLVSALPIPSLTLVP